MSQPCSCMARTTLHIIIDLSPRQYLAFPYVHTHERTHTKTYYKMSQFALWGHFLSDLNFICCNWSCITQITDRRAEAPTHAWFHQEDIKACHPSRTSCLSSPVSFMALCPHLGLRLISGFSQSFYSSKSLPLPLAHIPHPAVSCKTYCLTQRGDRNSLDTSMTQHYRPAASDGLWSTFAIYTTVQKFGVT